MRKHIKGSDQPLSLKCQLMCILAILTDSMQTWSLTELQKFKLDIGQSAIERSVLDLKCIDRCGIKTSSSMTGIIADIRKITAKLKWDGLTRTGLRKSDRMHPKS